MRGVAEERRRIQEEERRRKNLEKLQVENPSSIWDQIRNGELYTVKKGRWDNS